MEFTYPWRKHVSQYPEEILCDSENYMAKKIASYPQSVADKFEQGGTIILKSGCVSVTMEPPARPTFEVKAGRAGPVI